MKYRLLICLFFLSLVFPVLANAATETPDKVVVGVYPVAVWDLNPLTNSFDISFYTWWRGKKNNYNLERDMEIINAHDFTMKSGNTEKSVDSNIFYATAHYYAKIHQHWDTKYFPFTHEYLKVKLEANSDSDSTKFIPDYQDSHLHSEFKIPGWDVLSFRILKSSTLYDTDFGDANIAHSSYDRITFVIEIKHRGFRLYFSYFIGFFMAGMLSFLVFFMSDLPFPARATVFMSGVIAFITNKYTIDQRIPINSSFSLSDALEAATFIMIVLSIMTSIISELAIKNEVRRSHISRLIGIIAMFLYVSFIACNTYLAVIS